MKNPARSTAFGKLLECSPQLLCSQIRLGNEGGAQRLHHLLLRLHRPPPGSARLRHTHARTRPSGCRCRQQTGCTHRGVAVDEGLPPTPRLAVTDDTRHQLKSTALMCPVESQLHKKCKFRQSNGAYAFIWAI